MNLRNYIPHRKDKIKLCKDYQDYKEQLEADFFHHCGYCGDLDKPRTHSFEIDHFVPKNVMITIHENDYFNLVYSCKSCNNAKRAKWPTKNEKKCNDGICGWIDPCNPNYDKQFDRDENGNIKPVTELGKWMFDNLKLYKPQHRLLWTYEQLDNVIIEIRHSLDRCPNTQIKLKLFDCLLRQKDIVDRFYQE